nr:Basic leucine zipper (bZIP) transcription factor [Hymenolepis microstoma]
MQRQGFNPNQMSSPYNFSNTLYSADPSYGSNCGSWMPRDSGRSYEMPPYQMNFGQTENTAVDPLTGFYYENRPVLYFDYTMGSIPVTNLDDSVFLDNTSSDDFDFSQSNHRWIRSAETSRNDIKFKQHKHTQPPCNRSETSPFSPPIPETNQGSISKKSTSRNFDMEKELRRQRNNEASRKSRREKKRRFIEIERRVEEMRASNKHLTEFVQELDSIIEETKAVLFTVRGNTNS